MYLFEMRSCVERLTHILVGATTTWTVRQIQMKLQKDSLDRPYLKWGWMKYLSIVSVLPTLDGHWHTSSLEKQTVPTGSWAMYCCGWRQKQLYFSPLNKFDFFKCALYLEYFHCFTLLSDSLFQGGTEPFMFSSKPTDSFDKKHDLPCRTQDCWSGRITKCSAQQNGKAVKLILFWGGQSSAVHSLASWGYSCLLW